MATNVQYYEAALKTVYSPEAMFEYVKKPTKTLNELESTSDFAITQPGGRTLITIPIMLGLNQGFNTANEWDDLPAFNRSVIGEANYYSTQHTGVFNYSFRAAKAGQGEGGWKSIPVMEMDSVIQGLRQSINRQTFGDGTGKLATCSVGGPTNTITVDSTKFIYAHATNGQYVDLYDTNTSSYVAQGRMVTAKTATTITISGAAVTVTNTTIVVNQGSYGKEMNGLGNIIGSAPLGGLDPATAGQEEWAGILINANNSAPSLTLFQGPFQQIEDNGGKVDFIVASNGVQTAAANYLTSAKRIPVSSNPIKLPGGFDGIDWNGVPLGRDKDCPAGTAYFIDKAGLKIAEVIPGEWQPLDDKGSIVVYDQKRGYKAVWIWDMQLVAFARNRLAKMYNISES